jgi:threonine/homoserine/homoserine lactone efflux protein
MAGVVFGLTAGFAPGPLMTLVVTQTLRHNARQGALAAGAPLLTDAPIVLVSLFVANQVLAVEPLLGVVAGAGGLYVLYLAYETARSAPVASDSSALQPRSIRKAVMVNALNPHPYLFWVTVGAPLVIRAHDDSPPAAWGFIVSFYLFLIGSKLLIAGMIGKFRLFLAGRAYVAMMRVLGIVLAGFAVALFRDALLLLGVLRKC